MRPSTASKGYTKTAIILHWLIAVLLIGQFVGGKIMEGMDTGSQKYELFQLHKSFGITILLLSILRLLWRWTHKAPALPDGMKPYERLGAHLSHIGFYVLMIGIPIAGWILVSASTREIPTELFKTIPWPDFPGIARSEGLENRMKAAHEYMSYALIGLLLLHIAAGLKHHFVNKDDVLARMVPHVKPKGDGDA